MYFSRSGSCVWTNPSRSLSWDIGKLRLLRLNTGLDARIKTITRHKSSLTCRLVSLFRWQEFIMNITAASGLWQALNIIFMSLSFTLAALCQIAARWCESPCQRTLVPTDTIKEGGIAVANTLKEKSDSLLCLLSSEKAKTVDFTDEPSHLVSWRGPFSTSSTSSTSSTPSTPLKK